MTAVEWMINEIDMQYPEINVRRKEWMVDKAKEMEKEQHNETWDSAHQAGRFEGKGIAEDNWQTFETYWDETFKSE